MKHPSSEAAFKVAERLKNLPMKTMIMADGRTIDHGCAGCQYFASADEETQREEKEKHIMNQAFDVYEFNDLLFQFSNTYEEIDSRDFEDKVSRNFIEQDVLTDYSIGADMMARDLGFQNQGQLRDWADSNPEIWGNIRGDDMFGNYNHAYNTNQDSVRTLTTQEFYEHWRGVAERLKLLEDKEKEKKEQEEMDQSIQNAIMGDLEHPVPVCTPTGCSPSENKQKELA